MVLSTDSARLEVVIINVCTPNVPTVKELRPLWLPGGRIFETLVGRGFIAPDGAALREFHMDEVRAVRQPDGNHITTFTYSARADPPYVIP